MKVLVTGGSGVIGEGVLRELTARGHKVRLLSRRAKENADQWDGVEPFAGDVSDAASIAGAAAGCDAVLHIAGIVREEGDATFESVNVGGTRNVVEEMKRAGVRDLVFVSSLGADGGESDYHRSKFTAEQVVERSGLSWTILRPGNVYGPGDEVISLILKMVRALPAVPVIDRGDQQFQPIWHEDLAKILASALENGEMRGRILDATGNEITTMNDLIARFGTITGRKPVKIPVPMMLAELTTRLASLVVHPPVDENKLTMLREENVSRGSDAAGAFGVELTPLDRGLRLLADTMAEALPEDGVGRLQHKRFFADIAGSNYGAVALMSLFRARVNELMPIEFAAEPGAPETAEEGGTMTGSLPLRGNFQVRVEVVAPTHVVFATVEGHPLAGIVEFTTTDNGSGVRFAVDVYARPSNLLDMVAVRTVGGPAQDANWRTLVQRVIDASGGSSEGVQQEKRDLEGDEAAAVEKRVRTMVRERKKDDARADDARDSRRD